MPAPGQIDHVAVGLSDIPERLHADRVDRYLSVYLQQFNSVEQAAQDVIEAMLLWTTTGKQLDFVLDIIGALFDTPRPDGFNNNDYSFILQARSRVRRSSAITDDVYRVANFLARGQPVRIFRLVPKIIIVVFVDVVLTPQWEQLYFDMLLDTVDAVDQLVVQHVTSATAFYDIGLYDAELYAP